MFYGDYHINLILRCIKYVRKQVDVFLKIDVNLVVEELKTTVFNFFGYSNIAKDNNNNNHNDAEMIIIMILMLKIIIIKK